MNNDQLKESIKNYWNQASCGTEFIKHQKFHENILKQSKHFGIPLNLKFSLLLNSLAFTTKKFLKLVLAPELTFYNGSEQAHKPTV